MPELAFKQTTLSLPQLLWEQVVEVARVQGYTTNEVIQEALDDYLGGQMPKPALTPEEEKAAILKRLYAARARRRPAYEKAVAEGKIQPFD